MLLGNKRHRFLGLRKLQLPNGCYRASIDGTESDMRFLFCAASVCYILDDWSGMDTERAIDFILKSIVSFFFAKNRTTGPISIFFSHTTVE